MATEQMKIGPAVMQVRVQNWPDGEPGVWVQIGEGQYHFTLAGAKRLKDALERQIRHAEDARTAE